MSVFRIFLLFVSVFFSFQVSAKVPQWVNTLGGTPHLEGINNTDKSEIVCMAVAIYHEARGESTRGQKAVGQVMLNRTRSGRFPSTVCGVLLQRNQFSFIRNGHTSVPTRSPSWSSSVTMARDVYYTKYASTNWLYFCNCGRTRGYRIGNHMFY